MAISSTRRFLLWVTLLLILGAAVWWYSRLTAPAITVSTPEAVQVSIATVRAEDVPMRLTGLGSVQPWASVTVRARIDGQLASVEFQEGHAVQAGQGLAKLDDRLQQALLAQALAQRDRDQAQLDNARADLRRYTELARQAAIDRQTLDTQRAQVAALQATVQLDEAQIQYARTQLDYTQIVAPLSGRTGALLVDPGNQVRASDSQGLVVIHQIDPIAVSFTVPDTAFSQVQAAGRSGQPIVVQVYDRSASPSPDGLAQAPPLAQGELVWVDNQIDTASATLRLKARFDNAQQVLWPGQTLDVRLVLGSRTAAPVMPESAVQRGAQGLYVYVVDEEERVRVVPVQVLEPQDGLVVVLQGPSVGERVVVDGQYKLRPGMRVTPGPKVSS